MSGQLISGGLTDIGSILCDSRRFVEERTFDYRLYLSSGYVLLQRESIFPRIINGPVYKQILVGLLTLSFLFGTVKLSGGCTDILNPMVEHGSYASFLLLL